MSYILVSLEIAVENTALKRQSRPANRYELSLDTKVAKVGRVRAENGYCKQTRRRFICRFNLHFIFSKFLLTAKANNTKC